MRVFILFDLEGVTGYCCNNIHGSTSDFAHSDVNAAISGAKKAGASEIIVGDWHAGGGNLDKEELLDGITLEQYSDRFEIPEKGIDFAFFLGAHAMAGTKNTVCAHTEEYFIKRAIVDGKEAGEITLITYYFSAMGIPICLFSGSAEAMAEAKQIAPSAETAAVKKGFESLSLEESAKLIEEKAIAALKKEHKLVKPKKNELVIEYTNGKKAVFTGKDFKEIYNNFTKTL